MTDVRNINERSDNDDEIDVRELILVLVENWVIVLAAAAVIAAGVAIYATMLPNQYVSKTIAVSTSGGSENQMAGLAALAGVNISTGSKSVDLMNYVDLLVKSTAFCEKIIERKWEIQRLQTKEERKARAPILSDTMTLAQFWEFNEPDTSVANWEYKYKMAQVGYLRNPKKKFITVEKDIKTKTIEIKTRFKNPSLSYAVHEYLIDYLKEYIAQDYFNRGKDKRIFVEERVADIKGNLNRAEARLAAFQERNLTAQNPNVILEGERLQREVVLQASVYAELVKQLELAKIDEKKESPAFEIINEADFPLYPSEPNRKLLYLLGIVGGVFVGIFAVFAKEWVISLKNA